VVSGSADAVKRNVSDPLTLLANLAAEVVELRARVEQLEQRETQPVRRWLTVGEAAALLNCSKDAIRMRVARGRLQAHRQGRRVYVSAAAVERLA